MKPIPSWLTYTVLRLALFAIPLVVLLLLGVRWWLACIVAALVGLCLSYLLLVKQRRAVASDLYEIRQGRQTPAKRSADEISEDSVVDNLSGEEIGPGPRS